MLSLHIMIIAITGGIGCGKSVVSNLLRVMGYIVYDCDSSAKRLMLADPELKEGLAAMFGPETYCADGSLNKRHLSAAIFGNAEALCQMHSLGHPAVARDIMRVYDRLRTVTGKADVLFFFESAILFESHFDQLVKPDLVVSVSAPLETRIARAMSRDHASRPQILSRISSQMSQEEKDARANLVICNDDKSSVISQVDALISTLLGHY